MAAIAVDECPNCGARVETPFCPMCGQESGPPSLRVRDIVRDVVEDFVKWDSKLAHTVLPLVTRPGLLTEEWGRGRRARYISPTKLYLTAAFLFFLVAAFRAHGSSPPARAVMRSQGVSDGQVLRKVGFFDLPGVEPYLERQFVKIKGGSKKADVMLERMPQAMFLLLPLFAGALKLLFRRPHRYYVEHLVFALHFHAFAFLALTVGNLVPNALGMLFAVVGSGVYGTLALRRFYGQGWVPTLLKGGLIGSGYLVLLFVAAFSSLLLYAMSLPDVPTKP
ncbi:MAG: DUF3667 domain-containing protein [Fimbriimonas sp.]